MMIVIRWLDTRQYLLIRRPERDGGEVPETAGTVRGYLNETSYSYPDYCVSNATLREYYCGDDGSAQYNEPSCRDKCINGQCVDTETTAPEAPPASKVTRPW